MVSSDSRVRPNVTDVAAKVIDGEAIIMNLANGLYYSTDKVGAAIWELAARGYSVDEMAAVLADRYGIDRETAAADVRCLVVELLQENLVTVVEAVPEQRPALPELGTALAYERPVLNRYTDMADVLALDPPMPDPSHGTAWSA